MRIHGISMEPTYGDGEFHVCWRAGYWFREPRHGDVVAVRFAGPRAALLKRVVGLPGDTIAFRDGILYRNGAAQHEPYIAQPSDWNLPPRTVAPGTLYVIDAGEQAGSEAGPVPLDGHRMSPDAVLALLGALCAGTGGTPPRRMLVVGCEPADVEEGIGLSPQVAAAVPEAVRLVTDLVQHEAVR